MDYSVLNEQNRWNITEIITLHLSTNITVHKIFTYEFMGAPIPSTTNTYIVGTRIAHAFSGFTRSYSARLNRSESHPILTASWISVLKFHVIHAATISGRKKEFKYNRNGQ